MKLRPPSFWYDENPRQDPFLDRILFGLSRAYLAAHAMRQSFSKSEKCAASVICVGNLNAGGAGKTPTAIALMNLIKARNLAAEPFFLTRGYGGMETGPIMVDPLKQTFADIGDEPLLLAKHAPTVVSVSRPQGAALAISERADMIVMDDGLQNPSLHKDISLVIVDGAMGFGNKKLLPAGPLREPLEEGLSKADAFILIGEDKRNVTALLPSGKPIFQARIEVDNDISKDKFFIAFAGLAYPEKFFMTLRKIGLNVLKSVPYPDHYPYRPKEIQNLRREANTANAALITTEKDSMRLPENSNDIQILRVQLKFNDENAVVDFLKTRLGIAA